MRFVRLENVAAIDSALEEAYRRRGTRERDASCALLEALNEGALLIALLDRRKRCEKSHDWLRRLRMEMDALAQSPTRTAGRRRSSSVRGAATKSRRPKKHMASTP
jgi:hypothetical protein